MSTPFIVLYIIVLGCLIYSIRIFYYLRKTNQVIVQQLQNVEDKLFEKIAMELETRNAEVTEQNMRFNEDVRDSVTAAMQRMLEKHSDIIQVMAVDLSTRIAQHTEKRIDQYGQEAMGKLDTYLLLEQERLEQWIQRIDANGTKNGKSLEMAETALNQFPSSRALFDKLISLFSPYLHSSDKNVKKQALERCNRAIRTFLDNCSADDWSYADRLFQDNLKQGNLFLQEVEKERYRQIEVKVSNLEETLNVIGTQSASEDQIGELQRLDEAIDKRWLEKNEALKVRYRQAATRMIALFQRQNDAPLDTVKLYNQRAVEAIRDAHRLFQNDEKNMKQGRGLDNLIALLGGWETNQLQVAAQVYYQSVYSDIFSKLQPDSKPRFTQLILNTPQKKVS